jgi:hypothetical protein
LAKATVVRIATYLFVVSAVGAVACRTAPPRAPVPTVAPASDSVHVRVSGVSSLKRGDKVLLIVNGERLGTGTSDGRHIIPDPPLDTLRLNDVDSVAAFTGPTARQIYLLGDDQRGVVFFWISAKH